MKRTSAVRRRRARARRRRLFGQTPPSFHVDPLWPKPLPNHWLLGSVTGVAVDAQDHIWVVHRGYDSMTARTEIGAATTPRPQTTAACRRRRCSSSTRPARSSATGAARARTTSGRSRPAASRSMPRATSGSRAAGPAGDPGQRERAARARGRAAATAARRTGGERHAAPPRRDAAPAARRRSRRMRTSLKFSRPASSCCRSARPGKPGGDDSTTGAEPARRRRRRYRGQRSLRRRRLRQPARRRSSTRRPARYKRHWRRRDVGATNAVRRAVELRQGREGRHGLCLRSRQQPRAGVRQGRQVRERHRLADTRGTGSVWDIAFSSDPQQRFLFVADGTNRRSSCSTATRSDRRSFGDGGRYPGTFSASAASRWIRRATSTLARHSRASACRSSSRKGAGR